MFEPTSPQYFSNQSLEGILQRAIDGPWRVVWVLAVVAVLAYGLRAAVLAHADGDEVRAVAITGLVSVLVSPISWIHHLVWVVPVLAVIVGAGREWKRVTIAFVVAFLFVERLPYTGHDELATGAFATLLMDSYGLLCVLLLAYLGGSRPLRELRSAADPSARARLRLRRPLGLRLRRDAVGAAAVAGHDVLGALDADLRTEHLAEQRELRAAEAGARGGRGADRAVVLDEQQAGPVDLVDDLGDVALSRPDARERLDPGA
jgi:hypothetical protein